MTLNLLGKPILASSKPITLIMGPTAKSKKRKPFLLLKHPQKKNLLPLDKQRISLLPGKKPRSSRSNIQMLKVFQNLSSQLTSIGEILKESISLLNIEIKVTVDPATLFLSLKLLNNV